MIHENNQNSLNQCTAFKTTFLNHFNASYAYLLINFYRSANKPKCK